MLIFISHNLNLVMNNLLVLSKFFFMMLNTLKNLYEDGYRCIYYDKLENNHTIYLKNFDSENSKVVELIDENEFSQFQDYINDLKVLN